MNRRLFAGSLASWFTAHAVQAQTGAPLPGPNRVFPLPVSTEKILPNGLRIMVIPKSGAGIVTLGVLVRHSDPWLPWVNAGLGALTLELLDKGNQDPLLATGRQTAERLDSLGTTLDGATRTDYSSVSMTVLAQNLDPALKLLKTLVLQPTFDPKEVTKAQRALKDRLQGALEDGGFVAAAAFRSYILGNTPYRAPELGLPALIQGLKAPQVREFHQANFRPEQMVLVITGAIEGTQALELAAGIYQEYGLPPAPSAPVLTAPTPTAPATLVIDRPEAALCSILYGVVLPGRERLGGDFYPGLAFNALVGGGYTSRLNQELRIKRGLTYGAGSALEVRRHASWWLASTETQPQNTLAVLQVIQGILQESVTPEALEVRVTAALGERVNRLTTTEGIYGQVASVVMAGQPLSQLSDLDPLVRKVTPQGVQQFVQQYLPNLQSRIVIVGPAKAFAATLKDFPFEQISYGALAKRLQRGL